MSGAGGSPPGKATDSSAGRPSASGEEPHIPQKRPSQEDWHEKYGKFSFDKGIRKEVKGENRANSKKFKKANEIDASQQPKLMFTKPQLVLTELQVIFLSRYQNLTPCPAALHSSDTLFFNCVFDMNLTSLSPHSASRNRWMGQPRLRLQMMTRTALWCRRASFLS